MPDRLSPDFKARIISELQDMAGNIRNFLFTSGLRGIKLLDPALTMKSLSEDDCWGKDPVHPADRVYDEIIITKLSDKLCIQTAEFTSKKRPRRDSDGGGSSMARTGAAPSRSSRSDSSGEKPPSNDTGAWKCLSAPSGQHKGIQLWSG
jgi:hypothetical protein